MYTSRWSRLGGMLALAALVLALAAPANGAAPRTRFYYPGFTGTIAPGADDGATLSCPHRTPRAVGGFFLPAERSGLGELALDDSFPRGRRGWDVGIRNLSSDPQRYAVGVVCASYATSFVRVARQGVVAPGQEDGFHITCPTRAPQPVGGFFAPATRESVGNIVLADSFKSGRRTWDIGVTDIGDQPAAYVAGTLCAQRRYRFAGLAASSVAPPGGEDGFGGRCPRRAPHWLGPVFLPSPDGVAQILLTNAFAIGRRWDIGVRNRGPQAFGYRGGAMCAR